MSLGRLTAWEDRRSASIRESGNLAHRGRPFVVQALCRLTRRDRPAGAGRNPAATPARWTPEGASMRARASWPLASAGCTTLVLLATSIGFASPAHAAQRLEGTVVDQAGRPVPRARVRAATGRAAASAVFSDESGR